MRLLLVRHGITQHNLDQMYTGQTDAPLTDLGERQAEAAGRYLAAEKIDLIVSSDLQRTRHTAMAIARHHHLPVLEDPDLREVHMGTWEGFTAHQIQERNLAEWTAVRGDPINIAPPGGESFIQVRGRAERALQRYREQYAGKTVLWATHGGFIGILFCHALKLDLSYRHCFRHDNTSISELIFEQELPWITRLNDTAHLRILSGKLLTVS
ncbi:MAG TPA: histidine phosphatase family protein [Ktedonobacteraceae bacterium]